MAIIAKVGSVQSDPIKPNRPKWEDMFKNYPNPSVNTETLYNEIGGGLPEYYKADPINWENTCCIRMSKALNYSGVKLSNAPSRGGTINGKDGYKYWIRVRDLMAFLKQRFGAADVESEPGQNAIDKFIHKKGIIMFDVTGWGNATGHFTLWDGSHLIYPGDPEHDNPQSIYYYFNMKYNKVRTTKVHLWELK